MSDTRCAVCGNTLTDEEVHWYSTLCEVHADCHGAALARTPSVPAEKLRELVQRWQALACNADEGVKDAEPGGMTSFIALAQRVEREEPSRALDVEICDAIFGRLILLNHLRHGAWLRKIGDEWVEIGEHAESGTSTADRCVPRFTSSIDAAAMLMLPDKIADIWHGYDDQQRPVTCADVLVDRTWVHVAYGQAPEPHGEARARCAAALRTRAASKEPGR